MIIKVLICHPDAVFVQFLSSYLTLSGFEVKTSLDCVDGFAQCVHFKPHLVIANKSYKGVDARGLLLKKNATQATEKIPIFLIGDFTNAEIVEFKRLNASAFISTPVNPVIIVERIFNLFGIPLPPLKKTMPMLMDICARGNIIVAQIEGNLEPEKLELFNFYLRDFCIRKAIKAPRLLLIFPSLYPESVTEDNLRLLFKFTTFPEFKIEDHYIQILTAVPRLLSFLKMDPDFARYEIAPDFLTALQTLQLEFDKRKTVPAEFIKAGSVFIFDLYDPQGRRVIPAHTPVSAEMLAYLAEHQVGTLSYFSDFSLEEIRRDALEFDSLTETERALDILSSAYEPVVTEKTPVAVLDEKLTLFFRNLKGQPVLVVTASEETKELVAHVLDVYFPIETAADEASLLELFKAKDYFLVFIDAKSGMEKSLTLLRAVRGTATRRKTSVIIITEQINKIDVLRFKDSGTDNIVVAPVSSATLLQKVYEAIDSDRRT
jgi:DNA-binding response OmpR family regulator